MLLASAMWQPAAPRLGQAGDRVRDTALGLWDEAWNKVNIENNSLPPFSSLGG